MNCDAIIENLQAFLDNELESSCRSEVELHLKACKDCHQMVDDLGDLSSLLRSCDVPTPNLPTGQQLLAKAGYKPKNSFSQFIHSVYSFLFKYKAPVLATVSVVAVLGVVINMSGFMSFYSQAPSMSPQFSTQEKATSDSATKPSTLRSTPKEEEITQESNISNKNVNSPTLEFSQPKAVTTPVLKDKASNEQVILDNALGGVEGNAVVEISAGKSEFVNSEPASLPPSPSDVALEPKKAAKVETDNKTRDELEKGDSQGRAITIDKDALAKLGKTTETKTPSPAPLAEESLASKAKDSRTDVSTFSKETTKTKPTETLEEKPKKLLDGEESRGNEVAIRSSKPKASTDSNPNLSRPGASSKSGMSMSGSMSQKPAPPAREQEAKKLVFKSTDITLETSDLKQTKENLAQLAKEQQGDFTALENERIIKITIKIPITNFDSTLAKLRKFGNVSREKTTEKDIPLDSVEKQSDDSKNGKRAESKNEDKKSGEKDQVEFRRKQANLAVINLVLELKNSK
ncbi:MAG: zf-HC2 domain-containing protein [Acidobacteria bacterium]|nr:zf-HC2 domain-containing protein [Acidobacteriota bacterium]